MSRETWIYRNGKMVRRSAVAEDRSTGVMIISDALPDLLHPATGQRYDSKSRFRAETKARGLIEFGNERQVRKTHEMPAAQASVKQAIERLRSGYRPAPLDGPSIPRGEFAPIPIERVK